MSLGHISVLCDRSLAQGTHMIGHLGVVVESDDTHSLWAGHAKPVVAEHLFAASLALP